MPTLDDLTAPRGACPAATDRALGLRSTDLLEWADALDAADSPQMASAFRTAADAGRVDEAGVALGDR